MVSVICTETVASGARLALVAPAKPVPFRRPKRVSIKARARALPSRSRQAAPALDPGINKAPLPSPGLRLDDADGARKYVTAGERNFFLREAERADRLARTLCMTLAYAGCASLRLWHSPPIASTSPPACWCSRR